MKNKDFAIEKRIQNQQEDFTPFLETNLGFRVSREASATDFLSLVFAIFSLLSLQLNFHTFPTKISLSSARNIY